MAPAPKPPGQRRRRNAGQSQWRQLPVGGARKVPTLPKRDQAWCKSTVEWWKRVWSSPMATAWVDADFDCVLRLATMRDEVTRRPDVVALHAQITALEDRLGLSPKARRALQWEVAQAGGDPVAQPAAGKASTVRRLRAV